MAAAPPNSGKAAIAPPSRMGQASADGQKLITACGAIIVKYANAGLCAHQGQ